MSRTKRINLGDKITYGDLLINGYVSSVIHRTGDSTYGTIFRDSETRGYYNDIFLSVFGIDLRSDKVNKAFVGDIDVTVNQFADTIVLFSNSTWIGREITILANNTYNAFKVAEQKYREILNQILPLTGARPSDKLIFNLIDNEQGVPMVYVNHILVSNVGIHYSKDILITLFSKIRRDGIIDTDITFQDIVFALKGLDLNVSTGQGLKQIISAIDEPPKTLINIHPSKVGERYENAKIYIQLADSDWKSVGNVTPDTVTDEVIKYMKLASPPFAGMSNSINKSSSRVIFGFATHKLNPSHKFLGIYDDSTFALLKANAAVIPADKKILILATLLTEAEKDALVALVTSSKVEAALRPNVLKLLLPNPRQVLRVVGGMTIQETMYAFIRLILV